MASTPIYGLRPTDVYKALETSLDGLTSTEAAERRSLYGKNSLTETPPPAPWRRFIAHAAHPMAGMLFLAGGIAFFEHRFDLSLIIWGLVVLNAAFSYWREYRAEQAMEALRQLLPVYARLIRNGEEAKIPASEVVPGDILVLAEGDNIPADARVVEEFGLRTNNSNLTGEAVPSRKSADASVSEAISEVERPNLIFAGTSVVSGTGRAVVFATGMLTQFGRIVRLTQAVKEEPSLLQKELLRITQVISVISLGLGAIVYLVGITDASLGSLEAFFLALGVIVAALPEGLPATVTLSLAMAGQRLAQHQVLIKKLSVLETLGTVSVVCTDKSGTLTQNQMTVRNIWAGGQRLRVSGVGYEPVGTFTPSPDGRPVARDLESLLSAAVLCNNSRLNPPTPERPTWTSLGDQTEAALRVAAVKGGLKDSALTAACPRVHEIPFDARRKRMSTIHVMTGEGDRRVAFIKGAPREVLQLCTRIQMGGEVRPLDDATRASILAANDDYARNALRVLALARRELPENLNGVRSGQEPPAGRLYTSERVERDLIFLGLMAMMDPPRPEVAQAVQVCRQAGIRLVMITGDYGLTAESLARRVGMLATPNPQILTGAEIDALSDTELQAALEGEVIFARMAPEHKLRLVAAFQARGDVVAVTGDGVNDAPALRKANVGVAMGIIGTDVAKEAADLIITNDNFGAIVRAIEEGRTVYANLRKFITYIFSSNVPEMMPFILTGLFHIPLALQVKQILAIDMGTDFLPALALGAEKPEPDVMRHPPRRPSQPLIDRSLLRRAFLWLGPIEAFLCYIGFVMVFAVSGNMHFLHLPEIPWLQSLEMLQLPHSRIELLGVTVYHAGVVTAQIGNAFACRTEKNRGRYLGWLSNKFLLAGIGVEIAIILLIIYVPPLARSFDHRPLPAIYWLGLGLNAPILYTLDWIRKQIVRRMLHEEPIPLVQEDVPASQNGKG